MKHFYTLITLLICVMVAQVSFAVDPWFGTTAFISTWGYDLDDEDVVECTWQLYDYYGDHSHSWVETDTPLTTVIPGAYTTYTGRYAIRLYECEDVHSHTSQTSSWSPPFRRGPYHPAIDNYPVCINGQAALNNMSANWQVCSQIPCGSDPESACYCDGDPLKTCNNPEWDPADTWFADLDHNQCVGQSDRAIFNATWHKSLCHWHWQDSPYAEDCDATPRPIGAAAHLYVKPETPVINELSTGDLCTGAP